MDWKFPSKMLKFPTEIFPSAILTFPIDLDPSVFSAGKQ